MSRTLSCIALIAALLAPTLAVAGSEQEEQEEPRGAAIDFVAVVDVLGLDLDLVEALGLDEWDGPVVLARTLAGQGLADFYIRYDADPQDLGPLEAFEALGWLAPEWTAQSLPVVLTDSLDVAGLDALVDEDGDFASVVETAFVHEDLLQYLPETVSQADAVLVVVDGEQTDLPLAHERLPVVAPDAVDAGLLDTITPTPGASHSAGLLCLGPMTSDYVCIVADSPVAEQYAHWIYWTEGGWELPELPKETEEEETEVDEDDSGSEAPEADETEVEQDDSGSAPPEETASDDSGSAPPEETASDDSGSAPPDLSQVVSASTRASK